MARCNDCVGCYTYGGECYNSPCLRRPHYTRELREENERLKAELAKVRAALQRILNSNVFCGNDEPNTCWYIAREALKPIDTPDPK